jgi:hypothetical protein
MPKSGTSGSVRGAVSNDRPYRDIAISDQLGADYTTFHCRFRHL